MFPERSLSPRIARADAACPVAAEFEAEIASLLALHPASFEARSRIEADEAPGRPSIRAAREYAALGERFSLEMKGLLLAQSRERKEFVEEFGDSADNPRVWSCSFPLPARQRAVNGSETGRVPSCVAVVDVTAFRPAGGVNRPPVGTRPALRNRSDIGLALLCAQRR